MNYTTDNTTVNQIAEVRQFMYGDEAGALASSNASGQKAVKDGKTYLVLDPKNLLDTEAVKTADKLGDAILHLGEGEWSGDYVTERVPFSEAVKAVIEQANAHEFTYAVLDNLVPYIVGYGEEAFEGFPEGTTVEDIAVFYGDLMTFARGDLMMAIMFGQVDPHFNVQKLRIFKEADEQ